MEQNQLDTTQKNNYPIFVSVAILIASLSGAGVYAYQHSQQVRQGQDLQAQIDSLKSQLAMVRQATLAPIAATATATPTLATPTLATATIFKSSLVNLAFTYPSESSYIETDPFRLRAEQGLKTTGHQPIFSDKNKIDPSFDATTTDFSTQDSVVHDLLLGTLESKSSFGIAGFDKSTMITSEVAPGMFQGTAYGNQECSPGVASYLFVQPPQNSGLKYISFYLGRDSFTDSEIGDVCLPKSGAIKARIAGLSTNPLVVATLTSAIALAKTFTVK